MRENEEDENERKQEWEFATALATIVDSRKTLRHPSVLRINAVAVAGKRRTGYKTHLLYTHRQIFLRECACIMSKNISVGCKAASFAESDGESNANCVYAKHISVCIYSSRVKDRMRVWESTG